MTTIVNTPGNGDNGSGGLIIGIVVAVVVIALFFLYALPAMRGGAPANNNPGINVNVDLPSGNDGGTAPAPAN